MIISRKLGRRSQRGAIAVEFALTLPVVVSLCVGLVVAGQGVSQHQMVSDLAREASRWGSVHGPEYQKETGDPAATAADVYTNAIAPRLVGVAPGSISYAVTWSTDKTLGNVISVTVKNRWTPVAFMPPVDLSSTSVMVVSF